MLRPDHGADALAHLAVTTAPGSIHAADGTPLYEIAREEFGNDAAIEAAAKRHRERRRP